MNTTNATFATHNTVLTPELRAKVAADSGIGGGNQVPSMLAINPYVASADGDFPLGVTGKSLKRYLRDKYQDLVVYLGDRRSKNLATSAALA